MTTCGISSRLQRGRRQACKTGDNERPGPGLGEKKWGEEGRKPQRGGDEAVRNYERKRAFLKSAGRPGAVSLTTL